MTDSLQHSLHSAAVNHPALGALAVFLANDLLFLLAAGFAVLAWVYRAQVSRLVLGRMALSGLISLGLALLLGRVVHDPRPYLAEHYAPLAHVSADNGFPSDHTLAAALLTGWLVWFARRWVPLFAAEVLAVLLGRLAIGAHHTLDVAGSLLIAALSVGAASALRLGGQWLRPVLGQKTAV